MTENKKNKIFYGYFVVAAGFFIMVIMWGAWFTLGVFLKPLITEFGWSRAATSGAFSLACFLGGILTIGIGRLNDRFGPRLVMSLCGFCLGLGYLLMSQINTIWQLYLFYGIVALGMSGSTVPQLSTVARWFAKRRGTMTGIVLSGTGAGVLVMSPVAAWLISTYDWRISYTIIGALALGLIIPATQFLKRDPTQVGQSPYGANETEEQKLNPEVTGVSFREAIRTSQLWLLWTMNLCTFLCVNAVMVHLSPHTTDMGISTTIAATILALIGGLNMVGRIGIGFAGDRIGNKPAIIICFILMSVAFLWVVAAKEVWMFYLFAAIFGLTYGGSSTLFSPMAAELFGLRSHGMIFGFIAFGGTVGGVIGPVLAGSIYDMTGSYQPAWLVCAAVSITRFVLALFLRPTAQKGGAR